MNDELDPEELEEAAECPVCWGPGVILGLLGRLVWFRCRDCGLDFNTMNEEENPDD